ncbi:hypothetical protein BGW42_001810 [Actinomortierella wolfii]|nr:hypothetical protein BGW42_001810 [Actinomortierella wolfii]
MSSTAAALEVDDGMVKFGNEPTSLPTEAVDAESTPVGVAGESVVDDDTDEEMDDAGDGAKAVAIGIEAGDPDEVTAEIDTSSGKLASIGGCCNAVVLQRVQGWWTTIPFDPITGTDMRRPKAPEVTGG